MTTSRSGSGLCPNCGADGYDGKSCVNCRYNDGEKLYRPGWMEDEYWRLGVRLNWDPVALKPISRKGTKKKKNTWQNEKLNLATKKKR